MPKCSANPKKLYAWIFVSKTDICCKPFKSYLRFIHIFCRRHLRAMTWCNTLLLGLKVELVSCIVSGAVGGFVLCGVCQHNGRWSLSRSSGSIHLLRTSCIKDVSNFKHHWINAQAKYCHFSQARSFYSLCNDSGVGWQSYMVTRVGAGSPPTARPFTGL